MPQVGRVLARQDLAGGHRLADARQDLGQLAGAREAEWHTGRIGNRASRTDRELQRALTHRVVW